MWHFARVFPWYEGYYAWCISSLADSGLVNYEIWKSGSFIKLENLVPSNFVSVNSETLLSKYAIDCGRHRKQCGVLCFRKHQSPRYSDDLKDEIISCFINASNQLYTFSLKYWNSSATNDSGCLTMGGRGCPVLNPLSQNIPVCYNYHMTLFG